MREEFEKMAAAGKLERHHIDALVQLTDTGFCMHRSWGFGRIKTVDTVTRLVASHPPVLVHCHAGRSRSVVVVAGHLMRCRGLQPHEALQWVTAKREAEVTRGLEALLWHL